MSTQTPVADAVRSILTEALNPSYLELRDDSARHIGHAGHTGAGESHFHLTIASARFKGLNRLARHRMIFELLESYLKNQIHALSINALDEK